MNRFLIPIEELKGRQRDVLYLPGTGHTVVLGTAGSGKTLMAAHRSLHLSDRAVEHSGRTALITFNRTLRNRLNIVEEINRSNNVSVATFHEFAMGHLEHLAENHRPRYDANPWNRRRRIGAAMSSVDDEYPRHRLSERSWSFFADEIQWIQGMGITDEGTYLEIPRLGRGHGLVAHDRSYVWKVYTSYVNTRSQEGIDCDLIDVASVLSNAFEENLIQPKYRHVIMDEGQDLTPEMIRSVVRCVPEEGSVTWFGDYAQQIYGSGMSFRSAGLSVQKIFRFVYNYRNSAPIAKFAKAIADSSYFEGADDLVVPELPESSGPLPDLYIFADESQREEFFVKRALAAIADGKTTALLARTNKQADRFLELLGHRAMKLSRRTMEFNGDTVHCGTVHSAKGFGFDCVLVPFVSQSEAPPDWLTDRLGGKDQALEDEARLLYVATTRAKRDLTFGSIGRPTALLPLNGGLITTHDE